MRLLSLCGAWALVAGSDPVGPSLPWGIHIAYGSDPHTIMGVMWSTRVSTAASVAQYGLAPVLLTQTVVGSQVEFTDVNNTQYIHRLNITGLTAGTQYFYRVGDNGSNWSAVWSFTTQQIDGPDYHPVLAIYGDMGVDPNSHLTLPLLYADVAAGKLDVVLHIGDMAYDLDTNNAANGDQFMANIQNISARVPYHVCVGNHEAAEDFTQYIARFDMMPGTGAVRFGNSNFHSFNVGKAHIVMVSSEAYMQLEAHGLPLLPDMYNWLEADLAAVDRTVTPWIIAMEHRPMYCSANDDDDDCHSVTSVVRDGILGAWGLEALLYKYGVELNFGAHEHSYERNYPVYQFMWDNTTLGPAAYVDFDRTINILSGAAGCPENQDAWQPVGNPFSAIRQNIYGYGRLHILNETHVFWEMIDDATGQVSDSMMIVKHTHGPFNTTQRRDGSPAVDLTPLAVQHRRVMAREAAARRAAATAAGAAKPAQRLRSAVPNHKHAPGNPLAPHAQAASRNTNAVPMETVRELYRQAELRRLAE